jgi:transcriptional regulator with XRE-family HTH domain
MKERKPLEEVVKRMRRKGFNRTSLSFYSGIELARLSRILNGWLIPSGRDQERIAAALNVQRDDLFAEMSRKRGHGDSVISA